MRCVLPTYFSSADGASDRAVATTSTSYRLLLVGCPLYHLRYLAHVNKRSGHHPPLIRKEASAVPPGKDGGTAIASPARAADGNRAA